LNRGNQVTICISINDVEKSKRYFDALELEGTAVKCQARKPPLG
jgi:hypothetical protein